MRDWAGWRDDLLADLQDDWPADAEIRPEDLLDVELGLFLMERLARHEPAKAGWALLSGYPYARELGYVQTPQQERMLAAARHRLWSLRRRHVWQAALEGYGELTESLRAFNLNGLDEPAERSGVSVGDRWRVYEAALRRPPPLDRQALPLAEPGEYRFLKDRGVDRRWESVVIPTEWAADEEVAGHDVDAPPVNGGKPIAVPHEELLATAAWMEDRQAALGLKPEDWRKRMGDLTFSVRSPVGAGFEDSCLLKVDRMLHMVGMVGAGKSTLRDVLAVWAARQGMRVTLVVSDIAEVLTVVERFRSLATDDGIGSEPALRAAPILGASTRERNTQRLHRRLATRGFTNLLEHHDPGFDFLSTACPLDALRDLEADHPLRYDDAPWVWLRPSRDRRSGGANRAADRRPRRCGCPLWSRCPRHHAVRKLVDANIWVTTPAGLIHGAVPHHQNEERIRYLELMCRRSDLVVVDEADRVQLQMDEQFAPSATLVSRGPASWLDTVHEHKIQELARRGRLQLSLRDVERWTSAVNTVSAATDRLYAMLIRQPDLRDWVEMDYFSAWTLQHKLIDDWYPEPESPNGGEQPSPPEVPQDPYADRRDAITKLLDDFRDDPLGDRASAFPGVLQLARLTHELLHTNRVRSTRARVRAQLMRLADPLRAQQRQADESPDAEETPANRARIDTATRRLEFMLLLAALHDRLNTMTAMWPRVEAELNLDASKNLLAHKPPDDYRPLIPESPMGNVLGFQFLPEERGRGEVRSGELRFFRCHGVGREILGSLPSLVSADDLPGPNVILMSGTSWAGTSTRYHLPPEVGAILQPPREETAAVARSEFFAQLISDGHEQPPLKLSGNPPKKRLQLLERMLHNLARPRPGDPQYGSQSMLERELMGLDEHRRRILLLVGSYKEAKHAVCYLDRIDRWAGKVCLLVADDADVEPSLGSDDEAYAMMLRRGDVSTFSATGAQLLVAPMLALERGHNILNAAGKAAFGSAFFLVRPHPRPDDVALVVQAMNDWATRQVHDGGFAAMVHEEGTLDTAGQRFRKDARRVWGRLLRRKLAWRSLNDPDKDAFAWDQLVAIWQVIGRLVRGGVSARVVFVDAAFYPELARGEGPDTSTSSLLMRIEAVLAPYFTNDAAPMVDLADGRVLGHAPALPANRALVQALYGAPYRALRALHRDGVPQSLRDNHKVNPKRK